MRDADHLQLIGYVRVSTEEQARQGVSLDAQRDRLRAYCAAHGHSLAGIEADEGVSGKVPPGRRPGLSRALAAVRAGRAGGLLAVRLDRLSRSTRDVLDLADDSARRGWRLVSVDEALDTGTAAGRLVLTVLAGLAQMEREQVGERVRAAMDRVAREGRPRSRFAPFGARRIARRLREAGPNPRTGRPWTYRAVERILATADRRSRALGG